MKPRICLLLIGLACSAMLTVAAAAFGASDEPTAEQSERSVAEARDGLDNWLRFPWYDREQDDLHPIVAKPNRPLTFPDLSFLQILMWIAIAMLLAFILWVIVSAWLARGSVIGSEATLTKRTSTTLDRVEALTFLAQRPQDDLLGRAEQHRSAGDYAEAIIYLFSYQLVELDRRNLIRLALGKTNRQYLGELRPQRRLRSLVEQTMIVFEDVFFGARPLARERFEACWSRLSEFDALLAQAAVPATPEVAPAEVAVTLEEVV